MPQEWALRTEVPGTPSLQLLLLTPRSQPHQGWRPRLCDPCLQGLPLILRLAPPWRMRTGCQHNRSRGGSPHPAAGFIAPLHHRPLLTKHKFQDKITENFKTATALKHWTKLEGPSERGVGGLTMPMKCLGCIRDVSRTMWCLHPAFTLETCFNIKWISDETKGTGYLCP